VRSGIGIGLFIASFISLKPKRKKHDDIHLDTSKPYWKLEGKTDFPKLLRALIDLVPEECILHFKDGHQTGKLLKFFNAKAVPEEIRNAVRTVRWRLRYYHLPATAKNLADLADIAESYVEPELAIHFLVCRKNDVLLQWYDAFSDPMFLSGSIEEDDIKKFSSALGMTYTRMKGEVESDAERGL